MGEGEGAQTKTLRHSERHLLSRLRFSARKEREEQPLKQSISFYFAKARTRKSKGEEEEKR